jgi:hypothetical protein
MKLEIQPRFLISALKQEAPVRKGILKMIDVASIHLERIAGYTTPQGDPLYTLRVTRVARAVATVRGDVLVLVYVEPDHDVPGPLPPAARRGSGGLRGCRRFS